jgi:hypothetical protein
VERLLNHFAQYYCPTKSEQHKKVTSTVAAERAQWFSRLRLLRLFKDRCFVISLTSPGRTSLM